MCIKLALTTANIPSNKQTSLFDEILIQLLMSFDTKVNSYNMNEISFNYIGIAIEFNLLIT